MDINILSNGMTASMLDPSAYVQRVKIIAESKSQQILLADVERAAQERCPNYRHRDGRIYASQPGEPYFAVTVSPLNPNFEDQIEQGIFPVVDALLKKNYLPISSCEGHGDSRAFVRIAFGSTAAADEFVQEFGSMEYVTLTKLSTSANIIQYWIDGKPSWRAQQEGEYLQTNLEYQDINFLYKRKYLKVCYVDLNLYDIKQSIWSFFIHYFISKDIKKNKAKRIKNIANRILLMKNYEL